MTLISWILGSQAVSGTLFAWYPSSHRRQCFVLITVIFQDHKLTMWGYKSNILFVLPMQNIRDLAEISTSEIFHKMPQLNDYLNHSSWHFPWQRVQWTSPSSNICIISLSSGRCWVLYLPFSPDVSAVIRDILLIKIWKISVRWHWV